MAGGIVLALQRAVVKRKLDRKVLRNTLYEFVRNIVKRQPPVSLTNDLNIVSVMLVYNLEGQRSSSCNCHVEFEGYVVKSLMAVFTQQ
jgi:hypothetical protein